MGAAHFAAGSDAAALTLWVSAAGEDANNVIDAKDLVISLEIVPRKADVSSARVTGIWLANVPLPYMWVKMGGVSNVTNVARLVTWRGNARLTNSGRTKTFSFFFFT